MSDDSNELKKDADSAAGVDAQRVVSGQITYIAESHKYSTAQTVGRWTPKEIEQINDCIDRYGTGVLVLCREISKVTGRSKKTVERKLLKMGVCRRRRGITIGFNIRNR